MLLDIHHKYLGVTPITFEDIDFSKFPFLIDLTVGYTRRENSWPPPNVTPRC